MTDVVRTLEEVFATGGFVLPPLAVIAILLWYALGERAFLLRRGTRRPVRDLLEGRLPSAGFVGPSLLVQAARRARGIGGRGKDTRSLLDEAFHDLMEAGRRGSVLIRSLVIISPLLGLLGTVTGMIETFDSLADMELFSQSGGVAGGVSQALLSTQVGLCVAIPGLLLGRMLDRKERGLERELELIKSTLEEGAPGASGTSERVAS